MDTERNDNAKEVVIETAEEVKNETAEAVKTESQKASDKPKKEYPIWLYYVMIGLGVVLILMCILSLIMKKNLSVFGLAIGVVNLLYGIRGVKEKKNQQQ